MKVYMPPVSQRQTVAGTTVNYSGYQRVVYPSRPASFDVARRRGDGIADALPAQEKRRRARSQSPANGRIRSHSPSHVSPNLRHLSADTPDRDALHHNLVPHAVPQIYIQGVPIPLYESHHLWNLPVATLRALAEHIYKTVGPARVGVPVPTSDNLLVAWLIEANLNHLQPLQEHAVPHSVPHFYHEGVPIPLYEPQHLSELFPSHLRAHAQHLYNTLGGVLSPVPRRDDLLLDWLLEVHRIHLDHHLAKLRSEASHSPSRSGASGTPVRSGRSGSPSRSRSNKVDSPVLANQYIIEAEASKLQDVQLVSPKDLHRVMMDTLALHGLTATADMLKRESKLDVSLEELSDNTLEDLSGSCAKHLCLPESAAHQFREARELHNQQECSIEQCKQRVADQHVRLDQLITRLYNVRENSGLRTLEEQEASRHITEQNAELRNIRRSAEELQRAESQMKGDIERKLREKVKVSQASESTSLKMVRVKSKILSIEQLLEELRKQLEESEAGQAQRIRRLLLQWDSPEGPKRIAAETFAHVDSDHDMRLQWENDEICKFVRLMFYYHHVAAPPWPDVVWYELYQVCEFNSPESVDVVEALKFARGSFEAALRMLDNS